MERLRDGRVPGVSSVQASSPLHAPLPISAVNGHGDGVILGSPASDHGHRVHRMATGTHLPR